MVVKANPFILSYHFIGEMLILFLALYPLFYYNLQAIPFSAYLFSLFIALICFLLLSKITNRMASFMLMAPLLFVLNLVLKFEFFFSFVIAIMFVWRFMALYREMYLEGEMNIFQITILIVLIEVMIFKDPHLIGILLIQLFILTLGFFLANDLQNKQAAKRQMLPFILKVMLSFTGLLAILWLIGGSLFRSAWDYFLMPVWHLATNIFISIFVGLMYLLEKIPLPEPEDQALNQNNHFENGNMADQAFDSTSTAEYNALYAYIIIALIVAAILIFIFMKFRKQQFKKEAQTPATSVTTERESLESIPKPSLSNRLKNRFFNQPKHPIRKLLYRFEHEALKFGAGRYRHETIQEWLSRINADIDYRIYEAVRYGASQTTDQDQSKLKNAIEKDIQKRKEDLNG